MATPGAPTIRNSLQLGTVGNTVLQRFRSNIGLQCAVGIRVGPFFCRDRIGIRPGRSRNTDFKKSCFMEPMWKKPPRICFPPVAAGGFIIEGQEAAHPLIFPGESSAPPNDVPCPHPPTRPPGRTQIVPRLHTPPQTSYNPIP